MKVDGAIGRELEEMGYGGVFTDDMLDAFGIVEPPEDVAKALLARYGDMVDRTSPHMRTCRRMPGQESSQN